MSCLVFVSLASRSLLKWPPSPMFHCGRHIVIMGGNGGAVFSPTANGTSALLPSVNGISQFGKGAENGSVLSAAVLMYQRVQALFDTYVVFLLSAPARHVRTPLSASAERVCVSACSHRTFLTICLFVSTDGQWRQTPLSSMAETHLCIYRPIGP